MANEWLALGSALYSRLSSVSGSGTVHVFQDIAPGTAQPPYLVYQRLIGNDEYVFGGKKEIYSRYIVKVISDRVDPSRAWATYGIYEDALQNAPLNVSGYNLLRCVRSNPISYQDNELFWHVGGEFLIDVQKP